MAQNLSKETLPSLEGVGPHLGIGVFIEIMASGHGLGGIHSKPQCVRLQLCFFLQYMEQCHRLFIMRKTLTDEATPTLSRPRKEN